MKFELAQGAGRLLGYAVTFFRDWQHRNALQSEFRRLGVTEGERVLHDCGMSRSEFLSSLGNNVLSEDLLEPAMLSMGFDPLAIKTKHPEWSRDLARACTTCRHRLRCRDDLLAKRFATSHRSYCVNSDSFSEISQIGKAA
jgi:hypothetical protein